MIAYFIKSVTHDSVISQQKKLSYTTIPMSMLACQCQKIWLRIGILKLVRQTLFYAQIMLKHKSLEKIIFMFNHFHTPTKDL